MSDAKTKKFTFGNHSFDADNLNKNFFGKAGITKGDLVDYYERISPIMLPHLKDRALNMQRAPDGLKGDIFYQQEKPDYFPKWVESRKLKKQDGGSVEHVVCNNKATLIYLADQACVTQHTWLSKTNKPRHPDRIVFDLDPPSSKDFAAVAFAARKIRDLLQKLGAEPFIMLTGSEGAHVVIPIKPNSTFKQTREFASDVAHVLAKQYPDRLTVQHRIAKRRGRLFLDYLRNSYGQTTVAPYAVRLKENAPVAVPIEWKELTSSMTARKYNTRNIFRRISSKTDPWKNMDRHKKDVKQLKEKLEKYRSSS